MPTKKRHRTGSPDGAVSPEKRQNLLSDPRNINITRPYDPPLLPSNHALSNAMLHQSRANYILRAGPRPNRRSTEEEDAAYHFREREFVEREVAERRALHKTSLQERADKTQKKAVEKFRVGAERRKKARKEEHEKAKKEAEQTRKEAEYAVALAAALRREKDEDRRAELRKDPSANYRHILEVYRLFPLENGYKERNTYLTGLLANKCMPVDRDSEFGLAVTYAKDHWEFFGQWPSDTARFAQYERDRRAAVKRG